MQLSCRFLNNVISANSFEYADAVEFSEGDTLSVFIQLIDVSLDKQAAGFSPPGRRYMPAAGASLRVTLQNVNDSQVVNRTAVQAFPTSDPSIWSIPVLASDPFKGTVTIAATLVEPNGVYHSFANVKGIMLRVR